MSINTKVLAVTVAAVGLLAGAAQAGGKVETVTTLVCAPSAAVGPAVAAGCLVEKHMVVELAQCLSIVDGKCMGENNEIKKRVEKVKRWLKKL